MTRARGATAIAIVALALAACATPAERFDRRAGEMGFAAVSLDGDGFVHRAWSTGLEAHGAPLHVYIEHDGTPWIEGTRVAADPTPRRPYVLELMARDTGPRLLLGRPCYFAPADPGRCTPMLWTHRRYSPEVVASMVAALRGFLVEHPSRSVVLIGYSGGGTIAWLMAARMPEVAGVVTIAANLDTDAWARLHGYSPLDGSLNPAQEPPLPATVAQLHLYGGRDANVTPDVVLSFARRHPVASVEEVAEFDHRCCWIERWPGLLPAWATAGAPR